MTDFEPWRARREDLEIVTRTIEQYAGRTVEVVEFVVGGRKFIELVAAAEVADGAGEGAVRWRGSRGPIDKIVIADRRISLSEAAVSSGRRNSE